jgi:hypothetical protein
MYQPSFGTQGQVQFNDEYEYYTLLGYLAKSDGTTSLVWEHNENQGAWGSEGRIQFHTPATPFANNLRYTAGNGGNIIHRVNCNEFVQNLNINHHFSMGANQNRAAIIATVPQMYLADFNRGLSLP